MFLNNELKAEALNSKNNAKKKESNASALEISKLKR
jgi:hypothetical protein